MNFIGDLRIIAELLLNHYGLSHTAGEDTIDVIRRWVNVQLKLIRPVPRKVFKSHNIQPRTYDATIQQALQSIETKFTNGVDVNGHLSKSIFKDDYTDFLFSDWAVYHLHLSMSPDPENPHFMERSDRLLFVTLNENSVYFIDVREHDEDYVFAQKALLQTIHDNWPEVIEPYRLKGIQIKQDITDPETIHKLRKGGVTVIYRVGDGVYAPAGGGVTTAATSGRVTVESGRLVRMARHAERWATDNSASLLHDIQTVHANQKDLDLHLDLNDNGFFVVEMISKIGWEVKS